MSPARPPRLTRLLASACVPDPHREFVIGDLDEQFVATLRARGRFAASRRYRRQAIQAAWHGMELRRSAAGASRPARRFDMSNVWRDVRLGLRTAIASPGYSLIAIATLALAIGANTVLFSIANPLVMQALPIEKPEGLGWILEDNHQIDAKRAGASLPDFLEWREASRSFSALGAREISNATITGNGDAERIQIVRVTANLTDVWGLRPALGRLFQPGDDDPGRAPVVVLSHRYWKSRFEGHPSVLGRLVSIDGKSSTIVGVMSPAIEVYGYSKTDLWMPLALDPSASRASRTLRVVGRLAPGVSLSAANAEIGSLAAAQARDHANTNANWQASVVSTRGAITTPETWVLLGLLGVIVAFVLLIACANLANLVIARVIRRRLDFAVRLALGASRLQLVRPLLVESLLLSIVGGIGGLVLAMAGLRLINATAYDALLQQIAIDQNVLIFTAVLSLITPVLFSLWPALGAGRDANAETLRDARSSGGRPVRRRRQALVAAEVALALSLLVVSGLVLRTMFYYEHIDTGMDVSRVLTFRLEPPADRYPDAVTRAKFARDIVDAMNAIPGATGAAVASHMPVIDTEVPRTLSGTLHDGDKTENRPFVSCFAATPDFFTVSGIRLVAGRLPALSDTAGAQPVAVVNRMAAEKYFDAIDSALGRTITIGGGDPRGTKTGTSDVSGDQPASSRFDNRQVTIVGVVADTRDSQVTRTSPQVYLVFDQSPTTAMTVLVRSDSPIDRSADARAAMRRLDPGVAVSSPKTLATLVHENNGDTGIVNGLFIGFAVLALLLAAAGLYGVISQSVGQRQREIGVRLALGAAPASIRRMVLTESLKVTGGGMIVGLLLASVLARTFGSVLEGVTPTDPLTFGAGILLVLVVSIVAVWSPASRAMRVDPARTLRSE